MSFDEYLDREDAIDEHNEKVLDAYIAGTLSLKEAAASIQGLDTAAWSPESYIAECVMVRSLNRVS